MISAISAQLLIKAEVRAVFGLSWCQCVVTTSKHRLSFKLQRNTAAAFVACYLDIV